MDLARGYFDPDLEGIGEVPICARDECMLFLEDKEASNRVSANDLAEVIPIDVCALHTLIVTTFPL